MKILKNNHFKKKYMKKLIKLLKKLRKIIKNIKYNNSYIDNIPIYEKIFITEEYFKKRKTF